MKRWYRTLVAAAIGAGAVWAAFWLVESVAPHVVFVPLEAGRLTMLVVVVVAGMIIARRGSVGEASALFAGSGAAWALHEAYALSLCQSDTLYRPCTVSEIGWMAVPAIALLLAALTLAASGLTRTRPVG